MINGIDVSNHQLLIGWKLVSESDVKFAAIKCSEGTDYSDPFFLRNWTWCKTVQLVRGAYHFAKPSSNGPLHEVDYFLLQLTTLEIGDFLVLDMEDEDVEPSRDLLPWTLLWLEEVTKKVGFKPILYSNYYYMRDHNLLQPELAEYGLWLAAYQDIVPPTPSPWPVLAMWQYTNQGSVPGITGNCDLNWFFGDIDQLRKYGKIEQEAAIPQPSNAAKALAHLAEVEFHIHSIKELLQLNKEEG